MHFKYFYFLYDHFFDWQVVEEELIAKHMKTIVEVKQIIIDNVKRIHCKKSLLTFTFI